MTTPTAADSPPLPPQAHPHLNRLATRWLLSLPTMAARCITLALLVSVICDSLAPPWLLLAPPRLGVAAAAAAAAAAACCEAAAAACCEAAAAAASAASLAACWALLGLRRGGGGGTRTTRHWSIEMRAGMDWRCACKWTCPASREAEEALGYG